MIWERSREWYEPDYCSDPNRTCPICKKDCETIYVFDGLEVGCNECLTSIPEERWGECTSRVDGDYVYLKCPLCGKECDDVKIDEDTGEIVGCSECLDYVDSGEWNAEHEV